MYDHRGMGVVDYLRILLHRAWLILIFTGICTGVMAIFTYEYMVPVYQAKGEMLVIETDPVQVGEDKNKNRTPFTLAEIDANIKLMETYKSVILSPLIMEKVTESLDGETLEEVTIKNLLEDVTINAHERSQVMTVYVSRVYPEDAELIANRVMETFVAEHEDIFNLKNTRIITGAEVDADPISPKPLVNLSAAFAFGLMISIILSLLLGYPKKYKRN
ncbi:YveK family protein [Thalassobacillus hwangdonensis]|uniref:YveK family protein n=1 Tax=Thalassobacillus hwangdonensis TaxID=546108 RepID=A0ABW3L647_9BACI